MARIRTIKPEFFTSEDIVDLDPISRLLYISLWCEADKEGRLIWKPKTFKMRYFPADNCDIDVMCAALVSSGLIELYGDGYAFIPSFKDHQHINPRESDSKLPDPHASATRQPRVNSRIDPHVGREGKGKEGKDIHASKPLAFDAAIYLQSLEVQKPVADDWLKLRKSKKAEATKTAIDGIASEAQKAGLSLNAALAECCSRGWQGFKASWMQVKGVDAPSITTSLTNTDCVCCGAIGSKKIGSAWYCFQHDQHSTMEAAYD